MKPIKNNCDLKEHCGNIAESNAFQIVWNEFEYNLELIEIREKLARDGIYSKAVAMIEFINDLIEEKEYNAVEYIREG